MKEWVIEDLKREYDVDFDLVVSKIKKSSAKRVLLQFPDGLKHYATVIVDYLEKKVDCEFFIYLGSCYGACDTPVGMENLDFDLVIQFGHNALMPTYLGGICSYESLKPKSSLKSNKKGSTKMILLFALLIGVLTFVLADELVSDTYVVNSNVFSISGGDFYADHEAVTYFDPFGIEGNWNYEVSVVTPPSSGGGGGGGGGGGSGETPIEKRCVLDSDCLADEICISGDCFKKFLTKIVDVSSSIDSGKFLNFSYELRGAEYLSGQVRTYFWIEDFSGNRISIGVSDLYLEMGANTSRSTQIFIPEYLESGSYYVYAESYYIDNENINYLDKKEIEISGKSKFIEKNIWLLVLIGVVLSFIIFAIIYSNRKRISFMNYIRSIKISRLIYSFSEWIEKKIIRRKK